MNYEETSLEEMSLKELFEAADVIADYRSEQERAESIRLFAEACAELAEAIGLDDE